MLKKEDRILNRNRNMLLIKLGLLSNNNGDYIKIAQETLIKPPTVNTSDKNLKIVLI